MFRFMRCETSRTMKPLPTEDAICLAAALAFFATFLFEDMRLAAMPYRTPETRTTTSGSSSSVGILPAAAEAM